MTIAASSTPSSCGKRRQVVKEGFTYGGPLQVTVPQRKGGHADSAVVFLLLRSGAKKEPPSDAELADLERQLEKTELLEESSCSFCDSRRHSSLFCPEVFHSGC